MTSEDPLPLPPPKGIIQFREFAASVSRPFASRQKEGRERSEGSLLHSSGLFSPSSSSPLPPHPLQTCKSDNSEAPLFHLLSRSPSFSTPFFALLSASVSAIDPCLTFNKIANFSFFDVPAANYCINTRLEIYESMNVDLKVKKSQSRILGFFLLLPLLFLCFSPFPEKGLPLETASQREKKCCESLRTMMTDGRHARTI